MGGTGPVKNGHKELRAVFDGAGLPEGHPHQLRDTAAVEWLKAGIPLEEVSRLIWGSTASVFGAVIQRRDKPPPEETGRRTLDCSNALLQSGNKVLVYTESW